MSDANSNKDSLRFEIQEERFSWGPESRSSASAAAAETRSLA